MRINPQITKLRPLSCKKFAIEWRLNLQEKRKDTMLKNYKGRLLNMKNYQKQNNAFTVTKDYCKDKKYK